MSINRPLVSILVPIYNVEKYIERCVVSLFEQTYENIEYIFIDDCSPDRSVVLLETVIRMYPHRREQVKIVSHESNLGLASARITGIKNSNGLYLMNVDSDDFIEKDMIEVMVREAVGSDSDMVICDFNYIFVKKIRRVNNIIKSNRLEYISKLLTRELSVCVCGRLIKRSLYVDNSVYPVSGLNYAEDYVVTPRLVYYANNIVKVDKAFYNYVQLNNTSYTHNLSSNSIDNAILANNILCDFFVTHGLQLKLPLYESKAINLVTLLYAVSVDLLPKVELACKGLKLRGLKISLLHKFLLFLAKKEQSKLLYNILSIVNSIRKFS